mmetsp:Transcript_108455/g.317299  ORF Transcript_108455/g.317299 Transcript_108455/m.317299 type:complete len:205 (-) Transcript_108455:482-1096(-)
MQHEPHRGRVLTHLDAHLREAVGDFPAIALRPPQDDVRRAPGGEGIVVCDAASQLCKPIAELQSSPVVLLQPLPSAGKGRGGSRRQLAGRAAHGAAQSSAPDLRLLHRLAAGAEGGPPGAAEALGEAERDRGGAGAELRQGPLQGHLCVPDARAIQVDGAGQARHRVPRDPSAPGRVLQADEGRPVAEGPLDALRIRQAAAAHV